MVPAEMVGPLRNAVQKLAGGIDFFALDQEERDSLDHTLRHLWNPGDDQEQTRERTVPIEVVALAMRDRVAAQRAGEPPPPPRKPTTSVPRARTRSRNGMKKDSRPTVKINRLDHPASPDNETSATRSDGYRPPTKGKHTDVSR